MSARVIYDADLSVAAMYDSVTGIAFGPTFNGDAQHTAGEQADCFLAWVEPDPRILDNATLEARQVQWARITDHPSRCPLCTPASGVNCSECGEVVASVSSDGLCDGCVAEAAIADREEAAVRKAEDRADEARLAGAT